MQSSSHIVAQIEVLGLLLTAWARAEKLPADVNFERYTKARKYIGSKDRPAIAERYYFILRELGALEQLCKTAPGFKPLTPYPPQITNAAHTARMLVIASMVLRNEAYMTSLPVLFDGTYHHPALLTDGEWQWVHRMTGEVEALGTEKRAELNCPAWLQPMLKESMDARFHKEMQALSEEAPVDIRANTLKTTRDTLLTELRKEGFEAEATSISPLGIRLKKRGAIFTSPLFKLGHFEMQDEGSQIAALLVDAKPGHRVIDFCAGAGGKTLAIAAQMNNKGRILAFDISEKRLKDLPVRLKRAGIDNTEWHALSSENDQFLKRHKATADRVLVDAPCSGTGTWRRNPDLKWRLRQYDLDELNTLQLSILNSASRLVKPSGRLIYVTCSLLNVENEKIIDAFLQQNSKFGVVCSKKIWNKGATEITEGTSPAYLDLSPAVDKTDGFFAATLERLS